MHEFAVGCDVFVDSRGSMDGVVSSSASGSTGKYKVQWRKKGPNPDEPYSNCSAPKLSGQYRVHSIMDNFVRLTVTDSDADGEYEFANPTNEGGLMEELFRSHDVDTDVSTALSEFAECQARDEATAQVSAAVHGSTSSHVHSFEVGQRFEWDGKTVQVLHSPKDVPGAAGFVYVVDVESGEAHRIAL